MHIKKDRVARLEKVNLELKNHYLSQFLGQTSTMLAEEKKVYWEGFSKEYIRCYSNSELIQGIIYNVKFIKIYEDGIKVEILD